MDGQRRRKESKEELRYLYQWLFSSLSRRAVLGFSCFFLRMKDYDKLLFNLGLGRQRRGRWRFFYGSVFFFFLLLLS